MGLTERYPESLAALADVLGFPSAQPVSVNRAADPFRTGGPQEDLSASRSRHEAAFPFEYEVCAAAGRRLQATLDAAAAA